ncbi:MAG: hypothetical protein A3F90_19750 [Deltaproteobacteria bacterium RIFCSPLOWO2_12_FULL_60_19]|nr:MAG: hypothetical protein A3F90_19750 [Deltaproteobacteria bacterium RIFCSPLOWO2_12_FULL_60_19]
MKLKKRRQGASGFTIIELLVTVGVAAVIMATAVPAFMSLLPTINLSSAARQVATDLQFARVKAVSQSVRYRLSFVGAIPGATTYLMQNDSSGAFVTETGPFALPPGISVSALTATSEFQPRGTVNATSTITLQNGNSQTRTVQVALVGRVTIP